MRYEHTQTGPFYILLGLVASSMLVSAWWVPQSWVQWLLIAIGAMMGLFAGGFRELTVRDEGADLLIQFGPIPILKRRVAYADIESATRGRTTVLEGWGVHLNPGGGWTWNLWGFDCVELKLRGNRKLRVGTDDPDGLAAFLTGMAQHGTRS